MMNFLIGIFFLSLTQFSLAQEYVAHPVQEGETISSIAKKYNIQESAILNLNPDVKKGKEINVPKLIIPVKKVPEGAKKVDFTLYDVSPKETLYSISRSFGISIDEVKKYNPYLYERELDMNDELRIPVTKLSENEEEHITKNFNQSVTNSSFSKLKHLVLPKETKFSIAKKYGITIAELDSLNPDIETLQAGQFVNIDRSKNKKEKGEIEKADIRKEEIKYYVVPRRESLASILKKNEFSRERLEALNPALRYGGLSEGMVLKLPTKRKSLLLPGEKSINLENFIDKDITEEINLSLLLPFNLKAFENDSIDKELLLRRSQLTRIAIDFYTGVEMAVDSAKAKNIPVNLQVHDIEQRNAGKIESVFNGNSFSSTHAFIGPLLESQIQMVLNEIDNQETLLFSPLVNPDFFHKNLVKTVPSNDLKQEVIITYIDSIISDEINLVALTDSTGLEMRDKLKYTFQDVKFVELTEDYLQKDDIKPKLNKNKMNWFLLETTNYGKIETAIANLISLQKEDYNIRLFTSNRSSFFEDEISNAYLSSLNFTFVSASKELIQPAPESFSEAYKEKHGYYPNRFVVRGFDLAYDLILRLAYSENNFQKTLDLEAQTEYFESKFNYHAFDLSEGYYNDSLFLIQYLDNLETEVID
ncbi:LysM peptidoglycan-binding domain-containing protein [Psychroflexus planctonicus]|uniref:LysM domain-containing protein n=1 Tax=Psychroflexus planctonicus TaxID=1526575 RepID=A0ABQ1SH18_9FLAO|nr:LysM domain-containing protein [Psychroflexus planctonicus]GGE39101.1 hypothetical protein GCM10010832_19220 [Psychroflexus planctonicus]